MYLINNRPIGKNSPCLTSLFDTLATVSLCFADSHITDNQNVDATIYRNLT
jgi:hypothetical protein